MNNKFIYESFAISVIVKNINIGFFYAKWDLYVYSLKIQYGKLTMPV